MLNHSLFQLSDAQLTAAVHRLAREERSATLALVVHLSVFDQRRLYLGAAFPSLFTYCRAVLKLSEHEAYHRILAARTGRAFPLVFELLGSARINLTTVRLVAKHLTLENHAELLGAASGKSKRQVKELVASRFPQADVPASCRAVPHATPHAAPYVVPLIEPSPPPCSVSTPPVPAAELGIKADTVAAHSVRTTLAEPVRDPVRPLAPDRYEFRFTGRASTRDKLRMAQDLLRHAVPSGDAAEVFDRALTALLDDLLRKKFSATDHPGAEKRPSENTRHIPAAVKRAVWMRDGGRCAFEAKGRRCEEHGFLEFHHVKPFAAGGEATRENIALRCRPHNAHEAELFYGRGKYNGAVVRETEPAG